MKYGVNFFYKKTGLGVIVTSKAGAKINNELAQELQKPVIKKLKEGTPMRGLKIMFGHQI